MTRIHIALIRGINVGRAKRVPMAELRALVADLGYSQVQTLLNSGNVVFAASRDCSRIAAALIEKGLKSRVGISARVTVITLPEFAAVFAHNPLLGIADNPSRLLVAFPPDREDCLRLEPLTRQDWQPEVLALGARAAYLWCPSGILESRLQEAIGRILGDAVTMRNWSTVTKLHALAAKSNVILA